MAITKRKRKGKPRTGQRSSYFQAEVYVSGIRVASESFDTLTAASDWHDKTKARYEQGRGPLGEMTLSEVIDQYVMRGLPELRPATQRNSLMAIKVIEDSHLGEVAVADLSAGDVDRFLDELIAGPLAKSVQRKSFLVELKMVRVILNFYRDQLDERFVLPVTRRHFKRAKFKGPIPARRKDFFIPPEDANRWIRTLRFRQDPVYGDLGLFQLIMGVRIGEAVALKWDAVDLEAGQVEIKRTMDWQHRKAEDWTKTHSSLRTLPLPPVIVEVLMAAKRRYPDSVEVFRNRKGDVPSYKTICANYTLAFKEVGLPWRATHICRHTNATLARTQLRTEDVQANLGHSTSRQTEAYVHATTANLVPGAVAGLLAGNPVPIHVPGQADLIKAIESRGLKGL